MEFLLRLRKALLSNNLYLAILVVVTIITIIRISIPKRSIYQKDTKTITGIIENIKKDQEKITLVIKGKEKILAYYDNPKLSKIEAGYKVRITGKINSIDETTTKNIFSYKKYLERQNIFYTFTINKIKVISTKTSIFYKIKNAITRRIERIPLSSQYLKTFLLGDKSYLKKEVVNSYQEIGISHLFALSGMHVSVLAGIIMYLLKQLGLEENKVYLISSGSLLLFLFIVGFKHSIFRAVLFFILFGVNKLYYLYIKPYQLFIVILGITLLVDPNSIFNQAFLYSFSISLGLLLFIDKMKTIKKRILLIMYTSLISFIISLPITLYYFHQINLLSIIYNIFYIPLITFIVFPLVLITFIFPLFDGLLYIFLNILEKSAYYLNTIELSKILFFKGPFIIYVIYVIMVIICLYGLYKNKKLLVIPLIILLIMHYSYPKVIKNSFVTFLDVGQGDSSLIYFNNKVTLIDTGGKLFDDKHNISNNITIPYLKSLGKNKIETLIITHGDADHMGEAINLVNNIKIEKVIFNCGRYNYLEKELIRVLNRKKIKYYSCIKELNIDNNKLYFLQTKDYSNENDTSNVIYTELDGYKFMLMGDASVTTEKEILSKYNLPDIDVLKVGHHGSNTSSSKEFINAIKPKNSIISVGMKNRYGHPNKEVLENLKESKIYRTDIDGSIMFKIKNNKLRVGTCSP